VEKPDSTGGAAAANAATVRDSSGIEMTDQVTPPVQELAATTAANAVSPGLFHTTQGRI